MDVQIHTCQLEQVRLNTSMLTEVLLRLGPMSRDLVPGLLNPPFKLSHLEDVR